MNPPPSPERGPDADAMPAPAPAGDGPPFPPATSAEPVAGPAVEPVAAGSAASAAPLASAGGGSGTGSGTGSRTEGPGPASPAAALARIAPGLAIAGLVLALVAAGLAWTARGEVQELERELVRRQQGSADQAAEARVLATEARDVSRDTAAKAALLEAKLAEVALQRNQIDELLQSLSRSREENVIADVEAAIRVALQQSNLTGSAEPLVGALRAADERLARIDQPRLERLRRAITRDLDRVRSVSVPDVGVLLIKLDEVVRLAGEMPLLAEAARTNRTAAARPAAAARAASGAGSAAAGPASASEGVLDQLRLAWSGTLAGVWQELRSLVRVTRIEQPEAMLLAPEQGYLLRENLKLRVLNARLSLLSRQTEAAHADLQDAERVILRYFDAESRQAQLALEVLRQVTQQARQVGVPRPDETLAATAAAQAGR